MSIVIAPKDYACPPGKVIINASTQPKIAGEPGMACVIDAQAELGIYACAGLANALRSYLTARNLPTLFLLWPDAGPEITELQNLKGQRRAKQGNGGQEIMSFWRDVGQPTDIEFLGINTNVCVLNAFFHFTTLCHQQGLEPPLCHFHQELLGDTNWKEQEAGWEHFRMVCAPV